MKSKIIIPAALLAVSCSVNAQSDARHPEWVYKIRMVSVSQVPRKGKFSKEQLEKQISELKKQGVNTIMDHGSLQFLPDVKSTSKAQWQRRIQWERDEIYSKVIKDAGMKLFHHTTSTFVPIAALDNPKYREWVTLNLNTGKIDLRKKGTAYGDACFMDMNHPEFRKLIFSRMAEYVRRMKIDGWMTDEVEWLPSIYSCGSKGGSWKKFKQLYGRDYPKPPIKYSDPHWREYIQFRYDSGGDFYQSLLEQLRKENPEMMLSGCLAGISKYHRRIWAMGSQNWLSGWNWGFLEMEEGHCKYGKRAGFLTTTYWPKYYREMQLYNANGEANGWPCSYALGYPRRWQVENSEQFYIWAQCLTMGFRLWMRDYQAEPQWFKWESGYEKDLIKPKLISDVGIYFPEWTRDFYTEPRIAYDNWSGISEALAQEHVLSDQLIRWHLNDVKHLKRFKVIVIPSAFFLSGTMAANLKRFVADGGTVIAVGECAANDPFGKKKFNNAMMQLLGISWRPKWINGPKSFSLKQAINGVPAGTYKYPNGLLRVKPAKGAQVLADIKGVGPALIYNKFGKGQVYYFTGRLGTSLYNAESQKKPRYNPTFDAAGRKQFAGLVANILNDQRLVEVRGLPSKVMVNAYDTDGDFNGRYKRTIHILDSFDGFEPGETIPDPRKGGNAVCRFKSFASRNGGKPVEVILRGLSSIKSAKMISPDFKNAKPLQIKKVGNCHIASVDPNEFGRYSIIVVEK